MTADRIWQAVGCSIILPEGDCAAQQARLTADAVEYLVMRSDNGKIAVKHADIVPATEPERL